MSKLIMTKGLPGSGKSTWAKQQNAYRVNKDDLRRMMNNGKWSKINEGYILLVRDRIITLHLADKNDVIVDDTNLAPKHEARLAQLAREAGAEFVIQDFTHVPIEQCIKQDLQRCTPVGEAVIRKMHRQFLLKEAPPPPYIHGAPNAIIVDMDGTLALFGDKNPYDRDFENDTLNHNVARIIHFMHATGTGDKVLLVSGRKEKYREQTVEFLRKAQLGYVYEALYMRPDDDERKDYIIKREIYEREIRGKYNIMAVFDDRNQTVEGWRSLGLTCLQVAPGDF